MMSAARISPVRIPAVVHEDDVDVEEGIAVELPNVNKFGITWLNDRPPPPPLQSVLSERPVSLNFSEGESDSSDDGSASPTGKNSDTEALENHHPNQIKRSPTQTSASVPRFSRTISMPLPSRLGHLQNPYKPSSTPGKDESGSEAPTSSPEPPPLSPFRELSLELADTVQMIIQTLLQVSPAQVLDPAKEQFSACALSVPTPSMSAMFTSMKNLNYLCANMTAFCAASLQNSIGETSDTISGAPLNVPNDFDIGEMLQNVGDSLSGMAAQAGVDLVIYHGGIGLKHLLVKGVESGISYALMHILRQVLTTAQRGDSIEIGLLIAPVLQHVEEASTTQFGTPRSENEFRREGSPVDFNDLLRCTFDIAHKFCPAESPPVDTGSVASPPPSLLSSRLPASFKSLILKRLLCQLGASFKSDLPPKEASVGRSYEMSVILEQGSPSATNTPVTFASEYLSGVKISKEPTLDELSQFVEGLRGKKVTLYASSKGSFAYHLTSYLTAWGLDVSHVSELSEEARDPSFTDGRISDVPEKLEGSNPLQPASFIFIDDDVSALREQLQALRADKNLQQNTNARKRPSLAGNHRPKSNLHIGRSSGQTPMQSTKPPSVSIVHFTSLSNYKPIQDIVQSMVASYAGSSAHIPEVLIIPKPAGPRRFLTALHTAVTKPMVDPSFAPIATSPMTPALNGGSGYFNYNNAGRSPSIRPVGSRTNSDRSIRSSTKEGSGENAGLPPSPLGMSDSIEYFSEASIKLGHSPSSGLVIQSPDGQPAGIFFHPRARTSRNISSTYNMERDRGQLFIPPERQGSASRRGSEPEKKSNQGPTFSSLHTASNSTPPKLQLELDTNALRQVPKPKHRNSNSPRLEDSQSMSTLTPPAPRKTSPVDLRKAPTPPASPGKEAPTAPISAPRRRKSAEKTSTPTPNTTKKAKGPADTHIVPPISVLVVDDNPINQSLLSTFMKRKKIKYDVAKNGQEAVQKWRTGGFHLILMDIKMPIMDGIQATKEIRRLERMSASAGYLPTTPDLESDSQLDRTPSDESRSATSPYRSSVIIVALTASSLQSDRVNALAAGCNDFLTKPVSLLWLNNKIIEWGSIKALQMWADLRPDAAKTLSVEQAAQAQNVAEKLHVPRGRSTPSPSRASNSQSGVPSAAATPIGTIGAGFQSSGRPSPPQPRTVAQMAAPDINLIEPTPPTMAGAYSETATPMLDSSAPNQTKEPSLDAPTVSQVIGEVESLPPPPEPPSQTSSADSSEPSLESMSDSDSAPKLEAPPEESSPPEGRRSPH